MNAETAGPVGTAQLKQFHMGNIDMWRHPKYYKELRKLRNKSDQAISPLAKPVAGRRAPDQGPKRQASSNKLREPQATSDKHQAPSNKPQA